MTAINTSYPAILPAKVNPSTPSLSPQAPNNEDEKAQLIAALLDKPKPIEFNKKFKEAADTLNSFWEKYSPDLILTPDNPRDGNKRLLPVDRNGNVVDIDTLWSDWLAQRRTSSTHI